MEPLNITFLGTGNAVPTQLRNHTAILVNYKNESFLVDCGEGTQRQFKHAEISPTKLTKLFITHWHGDHILGIPGLLQTLAMNEYQKTLEVYGPAGTHHFFQAIEHLIGKFRINIRINEVAPGTIVNEKEFQVQAEAAEHDTPALAYSFIIKDKMRLDKKKIKKYKLPNSPLLGKLQAGQDILYKGKKIKAREMLYLDKGKKLTIILDTLPSQRLVKLAKDADVAIIESSFGAEEAERAKEYYHLTAGQAATIAKQAKAKHLILTHISQRYEHHPQLIEKEAKKIFKNAKIVKDLDTIVI